VDDLLMIITGGTEAIWELTWQALTPAEARSVFNLKSMEWAANDNPTTGVWL